MLRGREGLSDADDDALAAKLVVIGKALAIERILALIMDLEITGSGGLIVDDAIVGILPPFRR